MSPEGRFHSLVVTITVSLMFLGTVVFLPFIQASHLPGKIVAWQVALLASSGTYNLVAKGLKQLLRGVRKVKQWILGPSYLEGTWIGYFTDQHHCPYYVIEHFEQDLMNLIIRGVAYYENGETYAQWSSTTTNIDVHPGMLIYSYTCDVYQSKMSHQGIAVFNLWRNSVTKPPYRIEGYTADLVNNVRTSSREKKLSTDFIETQKALGEAKRFAEKELNVKQIEQAVSPAVIDTSSVTE